MIKTKTLFLSLNFVFLSHLLLFCQSTTNKDDLYVNHNHLDQLYEEIVVDNIDMAVIHIYSEFPNYDWVGDDDEGFTCVDDVARAAIYYAEDFRINGNKGSLRKTKMLIEYIMYMQSENGFYYNFIFPDYSINKTHQNSENRAGWWSWRAFWVLVEVYDIIKLEDETTAGRMSKQINSTVKAIKTNIVKTKETVEVKGISLPTWLPHNTASDQAALLVIALSKYSKLFNDNSVITIIKKLSDGISMMQIRDKSFLYDGAILSWQNVWHAWGNSQSFALLSAYEITGEKKYLETALYELDNFCQTVKTVKMVSEFHTAKIDNKYNLMKEHQFAQIAYSIRPMIFASIKAHDITGDDRYAELAGEMANWFYGDNIAKIKMYHEDSGVCYDGIISETEVNKNSGAESTIEALLSIQKISQNKTSYIILKELRSDAK